MKIRCEAIFAWIALTMTLSAQSEEKQGSSPERKKELAWAGKWSPSATQAFVITKDFELSFSEDFILPYLQGKKFKLYLQGEEGEIGADEMVEKRHLIFMLYPDDQDSSRSWLSIVRVDKIEGVRTTKNLYLAHFNRLPNPVEPAKN